MARLIAVLDIGKSNSRLLLVEAGRGVVFVAERPSETVLDREPADMTLPTRRLDIAGIEAWLLRQLALLPERHRISAILPIAHGAAMVLIDDAGQALLAPDYEDAYFDQLAEDYAMLRDPFAFSFSPLLPAGLNLGKQIFVLQRLAPALFGRVRLILTYPQYWAWRLSGVAASEVTSLGCHTDLWRPAEAGFSRLATAQGWTRLLPPVRPAHAVLGTLRPEMAQATGLDPGCNVLCGIHDSNASYLAHRITRPDAEKFAVISSGTWCVIFAHGAELERLRETQDMLANVDALGMPVPTARFMGGREFVAIAGPEGVMATPSLDDLNTVLAGDAMALPHFAPGGPFNGLAGRLIAANALAPGARNALATLYCALMADLILDRLGAAGTILIDGPFAGNPLFAPMLQSLRPNAVVLPSEPKNGVAVAAQWLADQLPLAPQAAEIATPVRVPVAALSAYRERWLEALESHVAVLPHQPVP
jgi:sugar (pentulose or hexulose) kinase